jgi:hypothetical protein
MQQDRNGSAEFKTESLSKSMGVIPYYIAGLHLVIVVGLGGEVVVKKRKLGNARCQESLIL